MKKLIIINIILIIILCFIPEVKKENYIETNTIIEEDNQENIEIINEEPKEEIEIKTVKYSNKCIELIKKYEGCKLEAYHLTGEQYYTIGYGHYGSDVKAGQKITQEQAEKMLLDDLKKYNDAVVKQCDYLKLNQNEFDALVSFTYNCGSGSLQKLTKNKTRNKEQIANNMIQYTNNNMAGLVRRRNEEKKLFQEKI